MTWDMTTFGLSPAYSYALLLLPVICCGGAMSQMMVDLVRREASKQRVERALLAFWMCMAILMSTHATETLIRV